MFTIRGVPALMVWLTCLACAQIAWADPAAVRAEAERIEDLRLLHRHGIQDLHDARALSIYLRGWGGEDRSRRVEDLFREAADLYEALRAVDHGGMAAQAQVDVLGPDAVPAGQFDLLQKSRRMMAAKVSGFYGRAHGMKTDLIDAVTAAAKAKGAVWEVESKPEPWPDPAREAGRAGALPFGWTLHTDFWTLPDAEREYGLAKAAKRGITFANVEWAPACNWGDIEKQPGQYDFAALDAALAQLQKHGMNACIYLHTLLGTPPAWHLEKEGTAAQFTVADGKDEQGNPRKKQIGINGYHKPTSEVFGKFLTAYAARLKEKWPAAIDAIYVEGQMHEIGAVADESAAMDTYWKKWSNTDTPWRTPEAIAATEPLDEAARVKAEKCREMWLTDNLMWLRVHIKLGWREVSLQNMTINHDFHRLIGFQHEPSRYLYLLASLSDNPNTGTTSPASYQITRSLAGDRWQWHNFVPIACGTKMAAISAEAPWQDCSHISSNAGLGGSERHNFPAGWFRYADWQMGDFGIGGGYLTPRKAQELAPVILNTQTAPAQVAILWSQDTLRRDRSYHIHKATIGWSHMLVRAMIPHDFLAEEELAVTLKGYRVLVLPSTQSLGWHTVHTIREWVAAGGTLIADSAPGQFDEFGKPNDPSALADVLGANVARMRAPGPLTPDKLFTGHSEGAFQGDLPPSSWMFESDMTAALAPTTGTARAWFAGPEKEVAIVENAFGQGKAIFSGYPVGYLYWNCAHYEVTFGPIPERYASYNHEQKQYEAWAIREFEKLGVVRPIVMPRGTFLRSQRGNDPDWTHVYRNGPEYQEWMFETDEPVRTVTPFLRQRDGIDNLYVGLVNSEMNYLVELGYFRSTLSGGTVTVNVVAPPTQDQGGAASAALVFDAYNQVPVPSTIQNGRVQFDAYLPHAQQAAFAVAPTGKVRLFGPGNPRGIGPDELAKRAAEYAQGDTPAAVEILDHPAITAFLEARRGKPVLIACGDTRFRPAADELAAWLKQTYAIEADVTLAGPRMSNRWAYQDGFGYTTPAGPDPSEPDILVGNCQENPMMWRYVAHWPFNERHWLPIEVNRHFPGPGRAIVMLSSPILTDSSGKSVGKKLDAQRLVIGATFPAEVQTAVAALAK